MTLKELKQYRSICAEIDETNIAIASKMVNDTVSGSDARFPYITHTVSVGGLSYTDEHRRLMVKLHSLEQKKAEIESFVDGIEDSLTRRMFNMRFIKGWSVAKVAYRTNNTQSSVKMRCKRYIEQKAED